jgi:hypothetical protein
VPKKRYPPLNECVLELFHAHPGIPFTLEDVLEHVKTTRHFDAYESVQRSLLELTRAQTIRRQGAPGAYFYD